MFRFYNLHLKQKDLMPIEMVWNDLKFFLTNNCKLKATKSHLLRNIRRFWQSKMDDLAYCNANIDHIKRVTDMVIAMGGRATGL
jgi:hypothetical protein